MYAVEASRKVSILNATGCLVIFHVILRRVSLNFTTGALHLNAMQTQGQVLADT